MHPEHLQRFDWISCTGVKHPSNETIFCRKEKISPRIVIKQLIYTRDDNGDHYMSRTERANHLCLGPMLTLWILNLVKPGIFDMIC